MTLPSSVMLAASVDSLGDLIFIVIFVVVSLGNFLYKIFKEKRVEKKGQYQASPEEIEERRKKLEEFRKKSQYIDDEARRREVWEKQMGRTPPPASPPELSPPPLPRNQMPKSAPASLKELIETWKSDLIPNPQPEIPEVSSAPPIATPVPVPALPKRETRRTSIPLRAALPLSEKEKLAEKNAGAAYLMKEAKVSQARSLGRLLRDPKRYREAVLLKEILDKPVAFKWISSAQDSD